MGFEDNKNMNAKEVVLAFCKAAFADFDADKTKELLAEDYIQHNPNVPTGAAPVLGFLGPLKEAGLTCETHRILTQGDLVVLHNEYRNAQAFGAGGDHLVTFDVFRVQEGKVVEHWDNLQPYADQTASGRTMVDGPKEIVDLDQTTANQTMIQNFIQDILIGGQAEKLTDYISTEQYDQHNPMVEDGLAGLGKALQMFAEAGKPMVYTQCHQIVAEGNFVFTMSEGSLGPSSPTAFFDLFRVEEGKIVEHWDAMSEIPEKMAHENGKF